jgi:IMP dehydrogenase
MAFTIKEGLTFDDLLLSPSYSDISSRSEVDLSVKINDLSFKHPLIPANMKTITGFDMAMEIIRSGGLAILHRFSSIEEQVLDAKGLISLYGTDSFAMSVGVKEEDKDVLRQFNDVGVKIICIDIAHGHSKHCAEMIQFIKKTYPYITVIAGNVATGAAAEFLFRSGADAVKVGVGSGSLCTTRIETGNGTPQVSALIECAEVREKLLSEPNPNNKTYTLISDGGAKTSGDICKALCFADMVMAGNLFSGCPETPGNILEMNGVSYKEYVGSSTHRTDHVEGVRSLVHVKPKFEIVLKKLLQGVKSGCSYQGARDLTELKDNPQFVRITNAGLVESHPHDVPIIR